VNREATNIRVPYHRTFRFNSFENREAKKNQSCILTGPSDSAVVETEKRKKSEFYNTGPSDITVLKTKKQQVSELHNTEP
jgi:hypothetical protein